MKKKIITIAIVSVAVLALGIGGIAYAQSGDPDTPDTEKPGIFGGFGQRPRGRGSRGFAERPENHPLGELMHDALAEALGITPEELDAFHEDGLRLPDIVEELGLNEEALQEAMEIAKGNALEQALEAGLITEDEHEQIKERSADGFRGFGRQPRGKGLKGFDGDSADHPLADYMHTALAEALGITPEMLDTYHEDGLRLPDIAEELGLSDKDLKDVFETARTNAMEQALEDGVITKEQFNQAPQGRGSGGRGAGRRGSHPGFNCQAPDAP